MSNSVLSISGVGKAFRKYSSEFQRIKSWLGLSAKTLHEFWALRDVSFSVGPGEAVGIVGQNGAGKSTLLKLVTGVMRPSEGFIGVNGRVSAILELGMGFNPEFTGRQNVYHAAGLMGLSLDAVESIIANIEAFAEIGDYFDRPVRTYSSGMHVRVAFAVATALRPDVLIIDEALSVGDAYFRHKSFARIQEFQEQGVALLIVSHDRTAVQTLCHRAILLERGRVIKDGGPEEVMDFYNALISERQENQSIQTMRHESGKTQTVSGSGEATVEEIGLFNRHGNPAETVNVGEDVELRIQVRCRAPIQRLVLGFMIKDRLGRPVYGTNTHHTEQALQNVKPGEVIRYNLRFQVNLGSGSYSVATALSSTETHLVNNYEWKELALLFNVANFDKQYFVGCTWLPPQIGIERWASSTHCERPRNVRCMGA